MRLSLNMLDPSVGPYEKRMRNTAGSCKGSGVCKSPHMIGVKEWAVTSFSLEQKLRPLNRVTCILIPAIWFTN